MKIILSRYDYLGKEHEDTFECVQSITRQYDESLQAHTITIVTTYMTVTIEDMFVINMLVS